MLTLLDLLKQPIDNPSNQSLGNKLSIPSYFKIHLDDKEFLLHVEPNLKIVLVPEIFVDGCWYLDVWHYQATSGQIDNERLDTNQAMPRQTRKRRNNDRLQIYDLGDDDVQYQIEEFATLSNTTHRTRTVMTAIPGGPIHITPLIPTIPDEPGEPFDTWSSDAPDLSLIKVKGKARRYENSVWSPYPEMYSSDAIITQRMHH